MIDTMTQIDLNFEKTNGRGDNSQKSNEIEVLEGKGSKEDIKAKDRAKQPDRNNMPGVDLS